MLDIIFITQITSKSKLCEETQTKLLHIDEIFNNTAKKTDREIKYKLNQSSECTEHTSDILISKSCLHKIDRII